jgi:hypothetical protein
MEFDFEKWAKKTQYIIIDSDFVTGTAYDFKVPFGQTSNVFIQEMKNVIGVKMVDFFVTEIDGTKVKYIDVLCPTIPLGAQVLDERNGQIFSRIALERNFSDDRDKQAKIMNQSITWFNPISLKNLKFKIFVSNIDGTYEPISTDVSFYFVIEITTLDFVKPHFDTNIRVTRAIEDLTSRVDNLIALIPKDPERHKKLPAWYIFVFILLVALAWYFFTRSKGTQVPQGSTQGLTSRVPSGPNRFI